MFEAVFTPNIRGSVSHRLAYRSALVLEPEPELRMKVYNFMLSLYKMRNHLVHSNKSSIDFSEDEISNFYSYCENIFITAINIYNSDNYPEKTKNWSSVMNRLDFIGFDSTIKLEEMLNMKRRLIDLNLLNSSIFYFENSKLTRYNRLMSIIN